MDQAQKEFNIFMAIIFAVVFLFVGLLVCFVILRQRGDNETALEMELVAIHHLQKELNTASSNTLPHLIPVAVAKNQAIANYKAQAVRGWASPTWTNVPYITIPK